MSFILDALKKSELERQRQAIPGLMDAGPLERRTRFPIWAVALVVLLGVNLAVLLVVLLRGSPSVTRVAPAPAALLGAASTTKAPRAAAPAVPASLPAPAAPLEPPMAPALRAAESAPAAPSMRTPEHFSPMDPAPGRVRDPVLTAAPDNAVEETLPTISEIDLSSQPPLPDLHLDVHVFAAKPADRFVYIDMRKYREGAALADGLTLERIRRDGVVLNYHGLRFVLPRQQ